VTPYLRRLFLWLGFRPVRLDRVRVVRDDAAGKLRWTVAVWRQWWATDGDVAEFVAAVDREVIEEYGCSCTEGES
jgi:hypothetical protein